MMLAYIVRPVWGYEEKIDDENEKKAAKSSFHKCG